MQLPKQAIRTSILEIAYNCFLHKGVARTSMQTIAQQAGIAVGNIYHYFETKDQLFCEVVAPTLKALDVYVLQENSPQYLRKDIFFSAEARQHICNDLLTLVKKNRNGLRLLLFESRGTSLESFFEKYTQRQMAEGMKYLENIKRLYPTIHGSVSPLFIQLNCGMWLQLLKILVQYEDLSDSQVHALIENYVNFGTGGWKALLNV